MKAKLPVFKQHPLVRGGHAQTLAGVFLPGRQSPYRAVQRNVRLEDDDEIVLHDDEPSGWKLTAGVSLLVHGLAGCHASPYMVRAAQKLRDVGIRTFRMDLRGCGAGERLAINPYHAGRSDDILAALREVVRLCPGSPISLIGFSLGGNLVLKLLGETPDAVPEPLKRAMVVNPAMDLAACSKALARPAARVYDRHLVKILWKQLQRRNQMFPDAQMPAFKRAPRRVIEFDEMFTAPTAGYESAEHYYARCSASQFLSNVRVSTLILTARDDPLVPVHIFENATFSPSVLLHIAEGGGHLGYIGRRGVDPDRRWMDWRVIDWITAEGGRSSG